MQREMKTLTTLPWNSSSKLQSLCNQTSVPFTTYDMWKYFFSSLFKIFCIIQLFFLSCQFHAFWPRPIQVFPEICIFEETQKVAGAQRDRSQSPVGMWWGEQPCGRFQQRGIARAAARGPGAAATAPPVAGPVLWLGAGWPLGQRGRAEAQRSTGVSPALPCLGTDSTSARARVRAQSGASLGQLSLPKPRLFSQSQPTFSDQALPKAAKFKPPLTGCPREPVWATLGQPVAQRIFTLCLLPGSLLLPPTGNASWQTSSLSRHSATLILPLQSSREPLGSAALCIGMAVLSSTLTCLLLSPVFFSRRWLPDLRCCDFIPQYSFLSEWKMRAGISKDTSIFVDVRTHVSPWGPLWYPLAVKDSDRGAWGPYDSRSRTKPRQEGKGCNEGWAVMETGLTHPIYSQ